MAVTCLPKLTGVIQSSVGVASCLGVCLVGRRAEVYHCARMVDRSAVIRLVLGRSAEVLDVRLVVLELVAGLVTVRLDLAFQILEVHPVEFVHQDYRLS